VSRGIKQFKAHYHIEPTTISRENQHVLVIFDAASTVMAFDGREVYLSLLKA